jgi:hypothetical protein
MSDSAAAKDRLVRLSGFRVFADDLQVPHALMRYPGIHRDAVARGPLLVMPDGRVFAGMDAVARILLLRPWLAPLALLHFVPGARALVAALWRRWLVPFE